MASLRPLESAARHRAGLQRGSKVQGHKPVYHSFNSTHPSARQCRPNARHQRITHRSTTPPIRHLRTGIIRQTPGQLTTSSCWRGSPSRTLVIKRSWRATPPSIVGLSAAEMRPTSPPSSRQHSPKVPSKSRTYLRTSARRYLCTLPQSRPRSLRQLQFRLPPPAPVPPQLQLPPLPLLPPLPPSTRSRG